MLNNLFQRRKNAPIWLSLSTCLLLTGCTTPASTLPDRPVEVDIPQSPRTATEPSKVNDSERLLAERLRHCQEDKRRLESALKENQKRNDELQSKLEALLAIDRDIRSRGKVR